MRPAESIDEVIERLGEIVDESRAKPSRLGYFAALYRQVTVEIKDRIEAGFFDDAELIERLDVVFANRYLHAYEQHERGEEPTEVWAYAFRVATQFWPIVLQHLLLGMNAHINLDLGIATAEVAPPGDLERLHPDYDRVNEVLASLVGEVQQDLARVYPIFRWLNRFLGSAETTLIDFGLKQARDEAWSFAERLAPLDEEERAREIARQDQEALKIARAVRCPGFLLNCVLKIIRVGERLNIPRIIDLLATPSGRRA